MAEIHILDSDTIDKIAAGEVVERPASVVKELVENAIDAGASAISVEIKDGGTSLIRVTDNGIGIERTQIEKAFMRHATSKIQFAEDLLKIHSLGFRGEALSSISAVSMVEMITKTKESLTGLRVNVEGAVFKGIEEIGAPTGTTLVVRNLFYNVPARRKFLKSAATEGSFVSELMEHLALSRADISFTYRVNGQLKFHTPGNHKLKDVIYMLYGKEMSQETIAINEESSQYHLYGFLGKPSINRGNRNFEIFFVNGRFIKSSILSKAIEEGGRGYYMQHKFPFCVLMLDLPTDAMDVNVHPTKLEVRFSNQNALFDFVMDSVRMALKKYELIPEVTIGPEIKKPDKPILHSAPEPFEAKRRYDVKKEPVNYGSILRGESLSFAYGEKINNPMAAIDTHKELETKPVAYQAPKTSDTKTFEKMKLEIPAEEHKTTTLFFNDEEKENEKNINSNNLVDPINHIERVKEKDFVAFKDVKGLENKTPEEQAKASLEALEILTQKTATKQEKSIDIQPEEKNEFVSLAEIADAKSVQMNMFEERMLQKQNQKKIRVLGQIFDTYWLFSYEDGLFIMDQHAAHEKVNFERMMKRLKEQRVCTQQVNPPLILSLRAREQEVFRNYRSYFKDLGYEIEDFGGNEIALRGIPQDLYGLNEKTFFEQLLDELSECDVKGNPQVIYDKIASMSCKAAVKGNHSMKVEEIETLILELLDLENPYHCPHGRPTMIKMTQYELDRKFKRIL